ncbi:hypothetical protein H9Y04_12255 [Streptomyces sp. TRM66268-LWL]|uniref:Lipoprotein n=1 Tax=Streptomyces polyasparticus TaxID=2767826 RepID=A0ABR7SED7_9ACTN|nr:hypothetical protein [Streptomyces polyasparticus]MBC9713342.1 hypothetical protein [Streptomyces polyasparticus]
MTRSTRLWGYVLAAALLAPALGGTTAAAAGPGPETGRHAQAPRKVTGTWISPRGGADRAYERRITFARDGSFAMQDLVAPCPPKVQCVWSGIVHIDGTYHVDKGEVRLTYATVGGQGVAELPTGFELAGPYLVQKLDGYSRAVYVKA